MVLFFYYLGFCYCVVVVQGVQYEQGIGQVVCMFYVLGDYWCGGQVEGDEVGFVVGQEVIDQVVQVECFGVVEGGQVECLEWIEVGVV